jgi:hypothetical protein
VRPKRRIDVDSGASYRVKVQREGRRCPKMAYSSRKIAAEVAHRATRATGEQIEAYHCVVGCHCWHVGHPPGSRLAAS